MNNDISRPVGMFPGIPSFLYHTDYLHLHKIIKYVVYIRKTVHRNDCKQSLLSVTREKVDFLNSRIRLKPALSACHQSTIVLQKR